MIISRPDLCVAIKNRFSLSLPYADKEGAMHSLTIEPYIYGFDRLGNEILKAYYIADNGDFAGWKLFQATKIPPIEKSLADKISFVPNRLEDFTDKTFRSIHCSVLKHSDTSDDFSDLNQNYANNVWLQYKPHIKNSLENINRTVFDNLGDIVDSEENWWKLSSQSIKLRAYDHLNTFIEIGLVDPPEILYVVAVRLGTKLTARGISFENMTLGLREVISQSLSLGIYDDFPYDIEARDLAEIEEEQYYANKEAMDFYNSELAQYHDE